MKKLITFATTRHVALALAGVGRGRARPRSLRPGQHRLSRLRPTPDGVLHLAKNCATATNAAAGADITGFSGATFTSASFTLASPSQCNGGSPRFDVSTNVQSPFFLGCNNVTPIVNANGSATYTFTAATIAAGGGQVPVPTGTISSVDVLLDVQGSADVTKITFNGVAQVPEFQHQVGPPTSKSQCKHDRWKRFNHPAFKNQGQCVSYVAHHSKHGESHDRSR